MAELPQVDGIRLIRALQKDGWEIVRQKGSHTTLRNRRRPGERILVSAHRQSLRKGTLAAILKQADITPERLKDLL